MNLGDPELELIDPTPNVHLLFVHFDKLFFWSKLSNRAVVRWSKRMYSCAGICSYEGRGGLCDIALSEPLLKLRPRKDLVETLLHEMIHALLFITNNDRDRDGHGPNFQAHMHRINRSAGLNISIYHSFHEEVKLYQTHWWRCDGPCQKMRPYFGIVRRSMNKAPGPSDFWWKQHQANCGGTYIKIKEPEKPTKKNAKAKPNADITKFITNYNNPKINVLKDCNNATVKSNVGTKSNSASTVVVTKKGNVSFNPKVSKPATLPVLFSGNGHILSSDKRRSNSDDAAATVRNIWANKQLPSTSSNFIAVNKSVIEAKKSTPKKHKADAVHSESPPMKIKKIDDYFKTNASAILKDVYGGDFKITQTANNKLKAVNTKVAVKNLVDCPVCSSKISSDEINKHLDECLNKDVIAKMNQNSKDNFENGSNKDFLVKEEAENEINRLKDAHLHKNDNKKVIIDNFVDLTSNLDYSTMNEQMLLNMPISDKKTLISSELPKAGPNLNDAICISDLNTCGKDIAKLVVMSQKNESYSRKSDNFVIPNTSKDAGPKVEVSNRLKITQQIIVGNLILDDIKKLKANKNINSNVDKTKSDSLVTSKVSKETIVKAEPEILNNIKVKEEPGIDLICPCCDKKVQKPVAEHLDECISFFYNDTAIPVEGSSQCDEPIVIDDDDDIFDESQTLNATGTKSPCPCCLEMVEENLMNEHLDSCLN